jgi:hypothetical protein
MTEVEVPIENCPAKFSVRLDQKLLECDSHKDVASCEQTQVGLAIKVKGGKVLCIKLMGDLCTFPQTSISEPIHK